MLLRHALWQIHQEAGDGSTQLHMNLSEIDDAQFKVSKEAKALNKAFYGDTL
jgi:hypothetical protein